MGIKFLVWILFVALNKQVSCQSNNFGDWSDFGKCSRTCGGGVQSRHRSCKSNSVVDPCEGSRTEYRSCNIQDCPPGSGDFRAAQCSEFDSTPLDGKLYKWLPFYEGDDGSTECQLFCLAEKNEFYHKLADKVIDGTPCNPDTHDVCIDGVCKKVGCDKMLHSRKQEDNCGICGGDDRNCKTVTGNLGNKDHNKVLRIPADARSIKITSHKPGKSYLAIQQGKESLILNRNIGSGKVMLSLEGLIFKYHVSDGGRGMQILTSKGPTKDVLTVSVIKQDREPVIYHYQYSIIDHDTSRQAADTSQTESRYVWLTGHWTVCSTDCGEGIQRRAVSCMDTKNPRILTPQYCNGINPPPSQRKCIGKICNITNSINVQWDSGDWGPCSTTCEIGEQSKRVICRALRSDGTSFITSDNQCLETYKRKPVYMKSCNEETKCPAWDTTEWSQCSNDCGAGEKTRRVFCRGTDSTGRQAYLDPTACSALDRPLQSKSCIELSRCNNNETGSFERVVAQCVNSVYGCCPDGRTPASGYREEGCKDKTVPDCLQPRSPGRCRGYFPKYYYNQETRRCEQFVYGGCDGNSNNFETREECERKCLVRDNHGADVCLKDKEVGPCSNYTVRWYHSQTEKGCRQFWFGGCEPGSNNFETQEECKKTCSQYLTEFPQFTKRPENVTVKVGGSVQMPCEATGSISWFKDGNGDFPASRERRMNMLLDGTFVIVAITKADEGVYTCLATNEAGANRAHLRLTVLQENDRTGSVGENTGTDVNARCRLDKKRGPCRNFRVWWYYNYNAKRCQRFWFGGCLGNANRFLDEEACKSTCTSSGRIGGETVVVSGNAQCRQNKDKGPCRNYKVQWYYNYNAQRCERFWYGGCRGNTNRFDNEEACKAACTSSVVVETVTTKPVVDTDQSGNLDRTGDICSLRSELGNCRSFKVKWFHNSTLRQCMRFWYGGCNGNGNNFDTKEDCEARCIAPVTTIAPLPTTKPGQCPRLSIDNIGACVEACQRDTDCEGNQKCCSNGCGKTCQDPGDSYLLTPPINIRANIVSATTALVTWTDVDAADTSERRFYSVRYAPVGESNKQYNTLNTTAQQVYVTNLQPNRQYEFSVKVIQGTKFSLWSIAAYNTTQSVTRLYKPGECPAIPVGSGGICIEGCSSDYDCSGEMKCCSTGCGHTCQNAIIVEVAPEVTPAPQPAAVYCSMDSDRGSCSNWTVKWHFSQADGRCKRFWYGSCGGNQNRFDNEADCNAACRRIVTAEDVCRLPVVQGPCKASHRRWYYDSYHGECREFEYGGCRGNENRFTSRAECTLRCGSDELKLKVNGFHAKDMTYNRITLQWEPPVMANEVRQYRLSYSGERYYRDQVQQDGVSVLDIPGSASSYSINGLKPATQYRFNLTAITAKGSRGPTQHLMATTMTETSRFKEGECPRVDLNTNINEDCERKCQNDYDCQGNLKCCRDSCGMSCQAPIRRETGRLCVDTLHGCCLDGVTTATGPNYQGCPDACQASEYGCCEDGVTEATGPNQDGCEVGSGDEDNFCEQSVYGCCEDGVTPAQGPNKEGCSEFVVVTSKPNLGPICEQKPERGPCSDYKVRYFHNSTTGRCQRFWFGGCDGNQNNFESDEDCQAACVKKVVEVLPVCSQPKVTGRCRGYFPKFFYNQETRKCEQFVYGGCDGNDNNFDTVEECQRRCHTGDQLNNNRCKLPKDVGPCRGNIPRWYYDYQRGECLEFGWGGCEGNLNNYIDKETCLSTCSVQVLPTDKEERDICSLPSETGRCRAAIPRWFYDRNTGVCREFTYGGCEGNKNNFETREACESKCNRQAVCQPYVTPAIACLAYIRRYTYTNGDCQEFIYGGCGGNSNNFETIDACRRKCVPSTVPETVTPKVYDNICELKPETGPCRARLIKWYYNPETSQCDKFDYGGCDGNPNKFDSQEECESFCTEGSGEVTVDVTGVDSSYCHLPKESGDCENSFPAWYYDHLDGVCKEFVFGGCGGNKNRFTSREICESSCSRETVCRLYPEQGNCRGYFQRYYHDTRTGQCREFTYTGCKGNANNFDSRDACANKCGDDLKVLEPAPFVNPSVPRNLTATYTLSGVNLTWEAPLDVFQQITHYMIEIKPPTSDWRQLPDHVSPPTTTYFTLDVIPKTKYRFRVSALDGTTDMGASEEVIVITSSAYVPTVTVAPPISSDTCKQPKDYGTCNGQDVMYYFDETINDCRPFYFSGCGGNNNRFIDPTACRERCLYRPVVTPSPPVTTPSILPTLGPDTGVVITGNECEERSERGPCSDYTAKWFHNVTSGRCQQFWYGGCEGNGNRFNNQEDCKARCVDRRPGEYTTARPWVTLRPLPSRPCQTSQWGCCPDGITESLDFYFSNCRVNPGAETADLVNGNATVLVEQPDRDIFIECRGPQGTYSWYKNRYIITSDSRYTIFENGSLLIRGLQKEDSGIYACSVDTGSQEPLIKRFKIQVEVPIKIFPTPNMIVAKPGENAVLYCQAYGNPQPVVSWSKGTQPISNEGRYYVYPNGTLVITDVQQSDISDYTCVARNGESAPAQRLVRLSLRESVSAKIKPVDGRLREGETMYLTCVASGYPQPNVQWMKMGVELFTNDRMTVNNENLRITDVSLDDTGLYSCVVSNGVEKAEDDKSIQVIPKDVEISNCVDSASLTMCRLIVRARLCGYTMYSKQCCYSCDQSKLRG